MGHFFLDTQYMRWAGLSVKPPQKYNPKDAIIIRYFLLFPSPLIFSPAAILPVIWIRNWSDPHSGSEFRMWIRIQRYKMMKMKVKAFLHFCFVFSEEMIFLKFEPKNVANLSGLGRNLKIFFFLDQFGDFIVLDPDPHTINADPHHCILP